MFNRLFGVELECGITMAPTTPPISECNCGTRTWNNYFEICEYCEWDNQQCDGVDIEDVWNELDKRGCSNIFEEIIYDGTDIEIKTERLKGEEGLTKLRKLMNTITEIGGYTTSCDGTHIHIDAPDYVKNEQLVERLGKTWLANSDHIYKVVDSERVGWHYCPQLSADSLEAVLDNLGGRENWYYDSERCDLNFDSLEYHSSIEVRLHEGTLNFDELRAWIVFMGTMIDTVANRKRYIPEVKSMNHLFRSLKLDRTTRAQLRRKAGIKAVAA